jgi:SSS family solute:Na+ symporter
MLAGLLKIPVVRKQLVAAMLAGGTLALTGKLINLFAFPFAGNIIILSSFAVNGFLLFVSLKNIIPPGKSDISK